MAKRNKLLDDDEVKAEDRGIATRMRDHNAVLRAGGSRRQAIRAYCAGNSWLEENAKAVGNW